MDIGLMMDSDYHEGQTQQEAFDEALAAADLAERLGFDGIWLAERHFSAPGGVALIASVGSAPLLLATAIAARTSRIRLGTAVLLLPLGHPVRLAEEVATLEDRELVRNLIERHVRYTGSARGRRILDRFETLLPKFVKVIPIEYKRVMEQRFAKKRAADEERLEVAANG